MINGERVRALMREKGIMSKDMAAKVGIGESMMSYILSGLREPSVPVLVRIARALDVAVDDIIMK